MTLPKNEAGDKVQLTPEMTNWAWRGLADAGFIKPESKRRATLLAREMCMYAATWMVQEMRPEADEAAAEQEQLEPYWLPLADVQLVRLAIARHRQNTLVTRVNEIKNAMAPDGSSDAVTLQYMSRTRQQELVRSDIALQELQLLVPKLAISA